MRLGHLSLLLVFKENHMIFLSNINKKFGKLGIGRHGFAPSEKTSYKFFSYISVYEERVKYIEWHCIEKKQSGLSKAAQQRHSIYTEESTQELKMRRRH